METIITQTAEKFIKNICGIIGNDNMDFSMLEKELLNETLRFVREAVQAYIKRLDEALVSDKRGRKEEGYTVERRHEKRQLQTSLGELTFNRTYFYHGKTQTYAYLADQILGLDSYQRVSDPLGLSLVSGAKDMSYQKACMHIAKGQLSRTTVMHKVRKSYAVQTPIQEKRKIPALHIDADESHVTLIGGAKSYVPLVNVYEGISHKVKRHECKNIFHISEYGKSNDDLWEQVLTEIEKRYEMDGMAIYFHGDGAPWIKQGLSWLPNAKFVLDKYHKNKAITSMTAGLRGSLRKQYERDIRQSLNQEDRENFKNITRRILLLMPDREPFIRHYANYLLKNIKAIAICAHDAEANNGGCTEPHVSHKLASRLSARPMTWSKKTLTVLAPLLAGNGEITFQKPCVLLKPFQKKALKIAQRTFKSAACLGAVQPQNANKLACIHHGKSTPLYTALKQFF